LGRAEPGAWRIEAGGLVAPARVVGMLGYRQEFDMGKAHLDDMGDQRIRHLVPAEEPAIRMPAPRPGMDLIDRDGLAAGINAGPMRAMRGIAPVMRERRRDD